MPKEITPTGWQGMTNMQKESIESAVETVLDKIHAEGREPNNWERLHLGSALNGAYTGWFEIGWMHAWLAGRPRSEVAPEELVPALPELVHLNMWQLRRTLAAVEREPTRIHFQLESEIERAS